MRYLNPRRSRGAVGKTVSHRRYQVAVIFVLVSFLLLSLQLLRVTVFAAGEYSRYANSESLQTVSLPALRGSIYDRFGAPLALTVALKSVTADPVMVTDPNKESVLLAKILPLPQPQIHADLITAGQFVYVQRLIPQAQSSAIQQLIDKGQLPGITLVDDQSREYPQAPSAQSVLGMTNTFGAGISGLEYQYNSSLTGKNGSETYKVTASGTPVPDGMLSYVPARPGSSLHLTIDSTLQYFVEKTLAGEIASSNAIGGTAVIMDVATGQILAMANLSANPLPGRPNTPAGFPAQAIPVDSPRSQPAESWMNSAIASVYEPGSVAKIATMTAALEDHVITPSTVLQVPDHIMVAGTLFHDAETHPTQPMTPGEIMGQSSNVGTIMIAKRLGKTVITNSFLRYGWGKPTGLNFPGETAGYLRSLSAWSGTAIGSVPIGQDEAVTPLQVLDSYNAIANGGVMVTPKLVLSVQRPDGTLVVPKSAAPKRIESKFTASEVTQLLENAVKSNGTAPAAAIPGYTIAGKTGTSQKPWPTFSGYQPGAFWGTFVGYLPAAHPVLSAIVMLDQPTPIYGGLVAAPVFSRIMTYALQRYGVTPSGQILARSALNPKPIQHHGQSHDNVTVGRGKAGWQPLPR